VQQGSAGASEDSVCAHAARARPCAAVMAALACPARWSSARRILRVQMRLGRQRPVEAGRSALGRRGHRRAHVAGRPQLVDDVAIVVGRVERPVLPASVAIGHDGNAALRTDATTGHKTPPANSLFSCQSATLAGMALLRFIPAAPNRRLTYRLLYSAAPVDMAHTRRAALYIATRNCSGAKLPAKAARVGAKEVVHRWTLSSREFPSSAAPLVETVQAAVNATPVLARRESREWRLSVRHRRSCWTFSVPAASVCGADVKAFLRHCFSSTRRLRAPVSLLAIDMNAYGCTQSSSAVGLTRHCGWQHNLANKKNGTRGQNWKSCLLRASLGQSDLSLHD
jgi:hypothetical protein